MNSQDTHVRIEGGCCHFFLEQQTLAIALARRLSGEDHRITFVTHLAHKVTGYDASLALIVGFVKVFPRVALTRRGTEWNG
eukprot:5392822-Pyramimonas_sp.AAC.1